MVRTSDERTDEATETKYDREDEAGGRYPKEEREGSSIEIAA
jgi:hypothetical protein